eukprot:15472561-Alexandrium_andersonii.AAC.1
MLQRASGCMPGSAWCPRACSEAHELGTRGAGVCRGCVLKWLAENGSRETCMLRSACCVLRLACPRA